MTASKLTLSKGLTVKSRGRAAPSKSPKMVSFFASYSDFKYNSRRSIVQDSYRMCDFFKWSKDCQDRSVAHVDFRTAMVLIFNELYGTNINNINDWHKLCVALDINPLPTGLKEYRTVSIRFIIRY